MGKNFYLNLIIILLLFSSFFTIHFYSINPKAKNIFFDNFFFDADIQRVILVFTNPEFSSIDVPKHPLYVLFYKPIGRYIDGILDDKYVSSLIIVSFFSSIGVALAYLIFYGYLKNRLEAVAFSLIFGFSGSYWLISSVPETPAINAFFLILAFSLQTKLFQNLLRKKLNFIIHLLTGFISIGTTISNIGYVFPGYINSIRKKNNRRIINLIFPILLVVLIFSSILYLSETQKKYYPGAYLYDKPSDFIKVHFQKKYFYTQPKNLFDIRRIASIVRLFTLDCVIAPGVEVGNIIAYNLSWNMLALIIPTNPLYYFAFCIYIFLLIKGIFWIFKEKKYFEKDIQLIIFYIFFNISLLYFFETVGPPFIFSSLNSFCMVFLLMLGYNSTNYSSKRRLLLIFLIILVVNNLLFMGEINNLLISANPVKPVKLI